MLEPEPIRTLITQPMPTVATTGPPRQASHSLSRSAENGRARARSLLRSGGVSVMDVWSPDEWLEKRGIPIPATARDIPCLVCVSVPYEDLGDRHPRAASESIGLRDANRRAISRSDAKPLTRVGFAARELSKPFHG